MEPIDFVLNHAPFICAIIFPLWFISLLIIVVYSSPRSSSSETKNDNNTSDTGDGTNTDDTDKDNNEDEKYITDNNEDEKHITTNMNKHIASIDTTLCLFLILFVFLVLTKL